MRQVTKILDADASLLRKSMSHDTDAPAGTPRRAYFGTPEIAARNAQLEQEVVAGVRTPESLFMLSREQVKSAKFVERMPTAPGQGW